MREERYGNFLYKVNLLRRLPKPVEISHKWINTSSKYQKPEFYSRLFDDSENGPFEVPRGRTKAYDKKSVPDAPKLYVL